MPPPPLLHPPAAAACGSCGTCTEIHAPGNGEVGASNKTKWGGEGWETYITMKICHWLYTIGCLEMGGEGGRVLTHWAGPQRGMATSSVSGQALAPWPWPLTPRVGGEGGRDRGAAAHVGVQCPTSRGQLHQDHQPAGPGTRGERWGTHFLPAPRCPAQVTEGSRSPIPAV